MARFLFFTSTEKGHLNPIIGVAQRLLRRGHRVGWITVPHPLNELARFGIEVVDPGFAPPPELVTGGEALSRLVRDPAQLRTWLRGLVIEAVPFQIQPLREAIRRFAPDAISTDGMLYQAVLAAHAEGVPYLGISTALTLLQPQEIDIDLFRNIQTFAEERTRLFSKNGIPDARFRTCEFLSPHGNVVFATRAFVGEGAAVPPDTELVGPSFALGERGDEIGFDFSGLAPQKPLVYASFGSQISHQPELLSRIAEAAAPLSVQLLLTAGDLVDDPNFARSLPGSVALARYLPQLEVLDRARLFVSHGGANSVMESMRAGVPLLLLPVCNDQPVQAHFLASSGAGRSDTLDVSVGRLREHLVALLREDGPERAAAARVRAAYLPLDGAQRASELLEQLAA